MLKIESYIVPTQDLNDPEWDGSFEGWAILVKPDGTHIKTKYYNPENHRKVVRELKKWAHRHYHQPVIIV